MIISTTDVMKNQNTCANNDLTTPFFALFENCMISISILFILKNLFKSDNEVQIMSILQMKGQFTNVLSSKWQARGQFSRKNAICLAAA